MPHSFLKDRPVKVLPPVHPADVQKTAITTLFGLIKEKRMPFGLQNWAVTFQWQIN
jgi:hypothetical protein